MIGSRTLARWAEILASRDEDALAILELEVQSAARCSPSTIPPPPIDLTAEHLEEP